MVLNLVKKSDVFAIGVVFWEVVNRVVKGFYSRPYSEYSQIIYEYQIVLQAANKGTRPTIPSCPEPMAELIATCWAHDPNQRPDADHLLLVLKEQQQDFERNPEIWNKTLSTYSSSTSNNNNNNNNNTDSSSKLVGSNEESSLVLSESENDSSKTGSSGENTNNNNIKKKEENIEIDKLTISN